MIRPARLDDVEAIVRLLADDDIGNHRERIQDFTGYADAFRDIEHDQSNLLVVAVDEADCVIGCIQTTFVRSLSYQGALRCLVEDVRVARDHRKRGVGKSLLEWAIAEARRRGCTLVELFMHRHREEARQLYMGMGFKDEHQGFRLML